MATKIAVKSVSKVFGGDPEAALELLEKGRTKPEILEETGQTVGVQDVSFDVEEGEIFVVMGLSGSGKSTLVRILNRLIPATAGRVEIDGEDVLSADAPTLRQTRLRKMAMVFQHFALFPHKTVLENVEYGLKIQGVPRSERHERARTALQQVGLEEWADRRPSALSGGMQQRVGLARALAVDPEILLMDEPFSALDPLIRRDMQNEMLELQRRLRKTVVFITHDLLEALILGDRIAIMKEGRFVQVGTAEEIVGSPADAYVAEFTKDVDRARVFSARRVAEDAHALDLGTDTVESAIARMEEVDRPALHALDGDRIAGLVTYRDAVAAREDGGDGLRQILTEEFPTTAPDTHLNELFRACTRGVPIAVVRRDGALEGVVRPEAVFEALSANGGGDAPESAPQTTARAA